MKKVNKLKAEVTNQMSAEHWVQAFWVALDTNHYEKTANRKYCGVWLMCPLTLMNFGATCSWRTGIDGTSLQEVENIARRHWLKKHVPDFGRSR